MYFISDKIAAIHGRLSRNSEMSFRTYRHKDKYIIQRYAIINPFHGKWSDATVAVRRRLTAANTYARADYANPSRRARWERLMRIHNVAAASLRRTLGITDKYLDKHSDPTHELRDYSMLYYYITAFYARTIAIAERTGDRRPISLIAENLIRDILTEYQPLIHHILPDLPHITIPAQNIFAQTSYLDTQTLSLLPLHEPAAT